MQMFIQQCLRFLERHDQLITGGMKQIMIARALNIHPSAYSILVNKILPKFRERPDDWTRNQIRDLFQSYNNISETGVRRRLGDWLVEMDHLKAESKARESTSDELFIDQLIAQSAREIIEFLQGTYDCYYLSSFGYRIKSEPLQMRLSRSLNRMKITKGNDKSPAKYNGFGYISNNQIFTVQLREEGTLIPDNFMAHFSLPPSYSGNQKMFKGLAVSMANSYMPIARKVILHKRADNYSVQEYAKLETHFWGESDFLDPEIVAYLQGHESHLEYLPIPHPSHGLSDLKKELLIRELSKR